MVISMGIPGFRKRFLLLGIGVLLGGLLAGRYALCSPVLLVTDTPFETLYGPRRAELKRIEIMLRIGRQVKRVLIGENAGPDMVSFALEEAHRSPYRVLVPYRYYEGAARYAEHFPQVPVIILGGRSQDPQAPGTIFVGTDTMLDLYRAGLCAGILAEYQRDGEDSVPGEVLFFQNERLTPEYQEAFSRGLREQGFTKEPKYLTVHQDYADIKYISCIVMQGAGTSVLERNLTIPVILFSWIDPALSSRMVKLVFDDAPWTLARKAVALIPDEQGGAIPSAWVFPEGRIATKEVLGRLKKVLSKSIF
ncbi:MAG: hypothetical protein LBQ30_01800 [Treponema sp.]|jgi:hypothetical protein|nr:hypothetical protein [Treponema sp.]